MDKCKTGLGYNVVPPLYTRNFMPPKPDLVYPSLDDFVDVNESVSESIVEKPTVKTNEPETARKENGAPIIEDWVSDSDEENVPKVNTVKGTRVNIARPKAVLSAVKGNKGNAVKASACWVWRPKHKILDHVSKNNGASMSFKRFDLIDAKESKSYLTDYEEIDGGFVAFGGNFKGGKITGKDFKLTDESHVLLKVPRKDNMYSVDLKNVVPQGGLTCLFAKATPDESNLWHRRLGHVNFKTMNKLVRGNLVRGLPSKLFEINQTCVACQKGKQHRASCKTKTVSSISQPLQMLHMDLFGPTFVKSLMKKMYCLVVTDDFSRFSWVFFLATKDETSEILKTFITGIENLIDLRVKVIRCDNGTEFKNRVMNQFCEMKGIKREFSVARTPQQNGVAERKNRTLIEAARTMLADSKLPTTFWAEAVNTACYVQNRVLVIKPHNKTPYELFLGRKPALSFMRPFGCPVTILNTIDHLGEEEKKDVEDPRNEGCNPSEEGERINQEKDASVNSTKNLNIASLTVNAASIEDNAVDENIVYGCADDPNIPNLEEIGRFSDAKDDGAKADMTNLDTHILVSPIPTTRIHKDHPIEQIIGDLNSAPQTRRMTKNLEEHGLFSSVQQRTNHKDFQNCLFAFFLSQKEPKKNYQMEKRAIGTKWVYKNKKDERGIMIHKKARLVAPGYTQKEWIDYDEVFAFVARIKAVRLFLAYASFKDFVVYQMDVKSAFLYGKIEEEVYVFQPPGFEDPDFPDRVYKLEKALYGLHQAPIAWYETLSTYLLENRFQRGQIDKTLFIKRGQGDILIVQVYVDDIIFGFTKKMLCKEFEKMMQKKFQMSSMGELIFFLGLQVQQKEDGIFISQDKYVTEILKKFGFSDVKTVNTPMETHKPLLKDADGEDIDEHIFQVNLKVSHRHAMKRIFRYLKGQPKLGLWYLKDSPFDLVAYTDSDYARASLDRKSTIGGC
ncbi:retrovirus-related pol polyprotein from transposon TNT 1-94 [Tanacetum coccineum]